MKQKNKLYTVNQWNKPLFAQGVDRVNSNIYDGLTTSNLIRTKVPTYTNPFIPNVIIDPNTYSIADLGTLKIPDLTGALDTKNSILPSNVLPKRPSVSPSEPSEPSKTTEAILGAVAPLVGEATNQAISGELHNGVSDAIGSIGSTVGTAIGTINPVIGAAVTVGSKIIGGVGNALFGTKVNQANLNAANQGTTYLNNFNSNAATFDDIQGPRAITNVKNAYKGGVFKKGWANRHNAQLRADRNYAETRAYNSIDNNINNIAGTQMANLEMNYSAFGGPLESPSVAIDYNFLSDLINTKTLAARNKDKISSNIFGSLASTPRFALGGSLNQYAIGGDIQTNGADFTNGLTTINAGGSHEENPYEGVQVGISQENGKPNLVEEGETIYNDYVYSARIMLDKEAKDKFHLPKKLNISYADLTKRLEKESFERPNDPISKAGLEKQMQLAANEQERQKSIQQTKDAQRDFASLPPEVQQNVINQLTMEQQANPQDQMQEAPMESQYPPQMGIEQQEVPQQEIPESQEFAYGGYKDKKSIKDKYKDFIKRKKLGYSSQESYNKTFEPKTYKVVWNDTKEGLHTKTYKGRTLYRGANGKYYTTKELALSAQAPRHFNNNSNAMYATSFTTPTVTPIVPNNDTYITPTTPVPRKKSTARRRSTTSTNNPVTTNTPHSTTATSTPVTTIESPVTTETTTPKVNPNNVDLQKAIYNSLGFITDADLDKWVRDNKDLNKDIIVNNAIGKGIDFNKAISDPSFIRAISKKNPSLGYALTKGYSFGANDIIPKEDLTFDFQHGGWGAEDYSAWNGSTDPVWKEAVKKKLVSEGMNSEQIAEALSKTDAYKRGTEWLTKDENNRLKYLQSILKSEYAPKAAKDWAKKFIDDKGWKEGASRDYKDIFGEVRTSHPGTYWKTPEEMLRKDLIRNLIINKDGSIEEIRSDVPKNFIKGNSYSWRDKDNNNTLNFFTRPEDKTAMDKTNEDEYEIVPKHKSEWPRYVGLLGPAVGLGMQAMGIGKPDMSGINAALNITNEAPILAQNHVIGNYAKYNPLDIWYEYNNGVASSRATDRAIMNNATPNTTKTAGLIANNYALQRANADRYRNATAYNNDNYLKTLSYNNDIDKFNAESATRVSMTNAEIANRNAQLRAQMQMDAARQQMTADAAWNQGIYGNVQGLFKGIGNLGMENAQHNTIADMAADGIFGTITDKQFSGKGLLKRVPKNKESNGGRINRKRKGLTF